MLWQDAIKESPRGTATRKILPDMKTRIHKTIIRYSDGSGFILAANDEGQVIWELSREAVSRDMDGYNDWEPSK